MKNKFPIKNKSIDNYTQVKKHTSNSFHQIFELIKKDKIKLPHKTEIDLDKKEIINQEDFVVIEATTCSSYYFFKQNDRGALISPLEAMCWGFYQLLMPDLVSSKTMAHYNNEGYYIGVSSKAFLEFKSTMEEPLKKEDLIIGPLNDLIISRDFIDLGKEKKQPIKEKNKSDSILFYIEDLDQMDRWWRKQSDYSKKNILKKKLFLITLLGPMKL